MSPETIDAMLAAGASAEVLAAAWKAEIASSEKSAAIRRAKDAERQRRKRGHAESRGVTRTNGDSPDSSPKENNQTPSLPPAEVSEPSGSSPQPRAWTCPPGVHADHWRDFRRNRRTRHLTDSETAYRGQLKALEQFADDEWPPGRLVEFAAAKGWGSINDPRVSRHGERSDNKRSNWESALAANMGSSGFS